MTENLEKLQKILEEMAAEGVVSVRPENTLVIDFDGLPESKIKEYLNRRRKFDEESLLDKSLQKLAHG